MVNELKTLKDLEPKDYVDEVDIFVGSLRGEAIKHIKAKIKKIEEHSHARFEIGNFEKDNCYMNCLRCRNDYVQIQWIRYFFNITDEELR
ncbi:MAG TPA: hypothetical protein ENI23_07260 [bacterium]|nr:hypothetical protein [bacterium]